MSKQAGLYVLYCILYFIEPYNQYPKICNQRSNLQLIPGFHGYNTLPFKQYNSNMLHP